MLFTEICKSELPKRVILSDEAYIVMNKVPCDVIQKWKKGAEKVL